jgi:hypothetical protein
MIQSSILYSLDKFLIIQIYYINIIKTLLHINITHIFNIDIIDYT